MRPTTCADGWMAARVAFHGRGLGARLLVQAVIDRLRSFGATSVRSLPGVEEHVRFPLPGAWATSRWPRSPSRS